MTCKRISVLIALLLLILLALVSNKTIQTYFQYAYPREKSLTSDNIHINDLKIIKLKQLQKIPLFGTFFTESLIRRLADKQNWQEVIFYCNKALSSILYRNSFQIWYLKAKSQCASLKLQECRKSAYKAHLLSFKIYQKSKVSRLFNIFNYQCKQCKKKQQLELLIL